MKNSNSTDLLSPDDEPPSAESFASLYSRNRVAYCNFLKSRNTGGAEDDIIQDTAIVVLTAIRNGKIRKSLDKYVWGVLRNTMNNHFRRKGRTAPKSEMQFNADGSIHIRSRKGAVIVSLDKDTLRTIHAIADEYEDLETLSFNSRRLERTRDCIAKLSKADQALMNGKIIKGLTFNKLAASLGLSLSNAKVRYHRIKGRINKQIREEEEASK